MAPREAKKRAYLGKPKGYVRLAETATGTGDNHDAILERDLPVIRSREISHDEVVEEVPTGGPPRRPRPARHLRSGGVSAGYTAQSPA